MTYIIYTNMQIDNHTYSGVSFYFETNLLSYLLKSYYAVTLLREIYYCLLLAKIFPLQDMISVYSFTFLCRSAWGCWSVQWKSAIRR